MSFDPVQHAKDNFDFWEARGRRTDRPGLEVTLMAEHQAFAAYVHDRELHLLEQLWRPEYKKMLDVGCGAGRLSLALADRTSEVLGTDFSSSLIERAREAALSAGHLHLQFEQAAVSKPARPAYYDVVLLSGVLNSLTDEEMQVALARCAEALRPGGMLFLRNVCGVAKRVVRPMAPDVPPSIHRTGREYRDAVEATPSLIVERQEYLFPPFCLPNTFYYRAVPKPLRHSAPITKALGAWFDVERRTADARLRWFGKAYPRVMKALGKKTAFEILVARKAESSALPT